MTGRSRALAAPPLLAMLLSLAFGLYPLATARAAVVPFRVVTHTAYEVLPAEGLVAVRVEGTATASRDAEAGDAIELYVISGDGYRGSIDGAAIQVEVDDGGYQAVLELLLNEPVRRGESVPIILEYELRDGDAEGDVRVRSAMAAFPAWSIASDGATRCSVSVTVPDGFRLDSPYGSDVPRGEETDAGHVHLWDAIADPLYFGEYLVADMANVPRELLVRTRTIAEVGDRSITITVSAWNDDADWGARVSDQVTRSIPVLSRLIGLPYIGQSSLAVRETVPRTIGGYAGIFRGQVTLDEIHIAYDADDATTLHEAAHAWFNYSLAGQRWILEGFASYYADLAVAELGLTGAQLELEDWMEDFAIPLTDWDYLEEDAIDEELYAYGASLQAAREIADRAGARAMAQVWNAFVNLEYAYQPDGSMRAESAYSQVADSGYLLDLLEEKTGEPFRDIFEKWVFDETAAAILDQRDGARGWYARLTDAADDAGWRVPAAARRLLDAWSFQLAALRSRRGVEAVATWQRAAAMAHDMGVALPDTVREAFEAGELDAAARTATRLEEALAARSEVRAAAERLSVIEWIGLLGSDAATDVARADAALAAGDYGLALELASAGRDAWVAAGDTGLLRVGGAAGGLVMLGAAGIGLRARRRWVSAPRA